MFTVVALCATLNGGGVVVSYGWDQHLGGLPWMTRMDLAWDYPGIAVQGECHIVKGGSAPSPFARNVHSNQAGVGYR